MTSYPSLFFFIFIFSYNVLGLAAVEKQQDKVWEKLFHYHQGKPLIRDKKFLFTLDEKNLSSFSVSSERSFWENTFSQTNISSLICRFPARYYVWSKGEKAPENFCPALAVFLSEFDVQNVALVFSSYYAQNAASLFGHTFLRFTRLDNRGQELLDWGISYSANMKNINTLSMIYKSFFSSFQGSLEVMPYYYKVREYNDFEFRPLWSYSLKVSGSEVKFLLYHLWELSQLDIPYQYLTHNCSSLILDVLNILKPQSNFRDGLAFYHIPIDTIKVLKKEGLLKQEVQYRASLMQEWESKFRALTIQEQKIFRQFSHTLDDRELTSERLIDTALDYYDFKYGKQLVSKDSQWSELQKQKNDLLIKRSKLSKTRYEPIKSPEISPDNVHPTRRISMGILRDDLDKKLLTISYRFAYHDPMDPIEGMTSRMKINFLQPEVVLDDHMNLRLQKIELLDIASWSYSPLLAHALTYEISALWLREPHDTLEELKTTKVAGALGRTFDITSTTYASMMLEQEFTFSEKRLDPWSIKIGPKLMIHQDHDRWRLRLTAKKIFEVTGYQQYERVKNQIDAMLSMTLAKDQVLTFAQNFQNNYNQSALQWSLYY